MNVVIIGAGQLGSRHLQGLALVKQALNIYLVDPSEVSLAVSRERFLEVDKIKNKSLYLLKSVEDLPNEIEFAIISTTSKYRLKVMEALLKNCQVTYLLLEKFLFPYLNDYIKAQKILDSLDTITYVNCGRRIMPGYKKIKELTNSLDIKIHVKGAKWNIGSNSIHFVDLFKYLTDNADLDFEKSISDLKIIPSKHAGFNEFVGSLSFISKKGYLKLSSVEDKCDFVIEIESDGIKYQIDEINKLIKIDNLESNFHISPQSQLTNIIFESLIEKQECSLTKFDDSVEMHLFILKTLNLILNGEEGIIT